MGTMTKFTLADTHMPWPYKYPMVENGTIAPILVRMKEKRKVGGY